MIVYRIQHQDGRGPFRPGFSHVWADKSSPRFRLPTLMDEFGYDVFVRKGRFGDHFGSGVKNLHDLCRWFSETERQRLAALGFSVVSLEPDRILGESKNQVLFACRLPLWMMATALPWSCFDSQNSRAAAHG